MKPSIDNEPLSSLTHLLAGLLSIAALTLMVIFASLYKSATHIVGCSIFGASLIILYSASTLYHFFPKGTRIKSIFQRLDHIMIFVLIAGTCTPIALIMPQRVWGWCIFGVIWALALIGITFKSLGIFMSGKITVILYIAMGWLIVIAIRPLMQWLSTDALLWLFIGGLFYTVGCVFFALDGYVPRKRWFGMHEVFHVFVMAGSFCHFWLIFKYIL
jgi:hemolysin III